MGSLAEEIDRSPDLGAHVDLLAKHYRLPGTAAAALSALAAMVLDPSEDVLPRRPATNRLVAIRMSSCAAAVELNQVRSARRISDIGSGLGFPGLVLASMLPQASVSLVEKRVERCDFLRRAVAAMGLMNVEVVEREAQRWTEGAAAADLLTTRSLGRLSMMVKLAPRFLVVGGTAVIWGNPKRDPAKEADAEATAEAVGMRPVIVHRTSPLGTGPRYLYVYEKVEATPSGHPREPRSQRRIDRRARECARAAAAAEAESKAVERFERVSEWVHRLEATIGKGADPEDSDAAEELARARALAQKVEKRIKVLARRRTRAERRVSRRPDVEDQPPR